MLSRVVNSRIQRFISRDSRVTLVTSQVPESGRGERSAAQSGQPSVESAGTRARGTAAPGTRAAAQRGLALNFSVLKQLNAFQRVGVSLYSCTAPLVTRWAICTLFPLRGGVEASAL